MAIFASRCRKARGEECCPPSLNMSPLEMAGSLLEDSRYSTMELYHGIKRDIESMHRRLLVLTEVATIMRKVRHKECEDERKGCVCKDVGLIGDVNDSCAIDSMPFEGQDEDDD